MRFSDCSRAVVIWSFVSCAVLEAQAPQHWTPELAMQVKRVSNVRVSPDGRYTAFEVAVPVTEGSQSEWLTHIHIGGSDGSGTRQLTRGDKSANAAAWSPDGQWIGFLSARSGTTNVWRIPIDGGEAQQITDVRGSVNSFLWSPDGTQVVFAMADPPTDEEKEAAREKRDARVVDEDFDMVRLYVEPIESESDDARQGRLLTEGDISVATMFSSRSYDWSPDGNSIVFAHTPTPKVNDFPRTDISVVDVASGAVRSLAQTGAREFEPVYSPDGRWIAYRASDTPATWAFTSRLHIVPAEGGRPRALTHSFDRQPTIIGWSSDGSRIFIAETRGTVNQANALPVAGGDPVNIGPVDVMVSSPRLNRTGTHLGFFSEAPNRPPEAFQSRIDRFTARQVSTVQDLPDLSIGTTEVIRWTSNDGTPVEGLVTYPVGYRSDRPVPLLVIVHGGPTGVFTRSFIGARGAYPIAVFASRGYAILRANPRGSSGYGKAFRYANYGDWGGGDYRDIMSGVDALIERGIADPNRLGVMGWSYGGYMTSWIITQTDRFKAASVGAGLPNLMSFAGTADVPDFVPDYFGGDFWEVPEKWQAHSAMFNINGVSTPTLIQHGEQDRRVPVSQAYELYTALKRQAVDTKLIIYPRQPHGIEEPKLQLDAMHRNLAWFDRWVMGQIQ